MKFRETIWPAVIFQMFLIAAILLLLVQISVSRGAKEGEPIISGNREAFTLEDYVSMKPEHDPFEIRRVCLEALYELYRREALERQQARIEQGQ